MGEITGLITPPLPASGTASNRAISFGDSHQGLAWGYQSCVTTANTGFSVTNGIASLTLASNFTGLTGGYAFIWNPGDATMKDALNGAFVKVLTAPSNTTLTVSASYGGNTMPNGDYSAGYNSTPWNISAFNWGGDDSFLRWLNFKNKNPLQWVANYGGVALTSAQILAMVPKALAGPLFQTVFLNGGTNDMQPSQTNTAESAAQKAQGAYQNLTAAAAQFATAGKKVVMVTPPPVNSTASSAAIVNTALLQLRNQLVAYARRNNLPVIDMFGESVDGTTGNMLAAYANGADPVHLTNGGCYVLGTDPTNVASLQSLANTTDSSSVSLLDDASTYSTNYMPAWATGQTYTVPYVVANGGNIYYLQKAGPSTTSGTGPSGTNPVVGSDGYVWTWVDVDSRNIVPHGLMDGTGGTLAGGITGTVPTGWTISGLTNCTGTSSSQQALVRTGGNSAKWGYGWNLNLTFSAAGQFVATTADLFSSWILGQTYQAGITMTPQANFSNVNFLSPTVQPPVNANFGAQIYLSTTSNVNSNINVLAADPPIEFLSEPFPIAPGSTTDFSLLGFGTLFLVIKTSAAGSAQFQLSNAFIRAVRAP